MNQSSTFGRVSSARRALQRAGLVDEMAGRRISRIGARRQEDAFEKTVFVLDAVVLAGSFVASYYIRDRLLGFGELHPLPEYLWILGIILPTWLGLGHFAGVTRSSVYAAPKRLVVLTLQAHVVGALLLLSALYLLRSIEVSRLLMQTYVVVGAVALVVERLALRHALALRNRAGQAQRQRLLIIGVNGAAALLQHRMKQNPQWPAEIAGFIATGPTTVDHCDGVPIVGGLDDLTRLLDTLVFDEVVMAEARLDGATIEEIVDECLVRGITYCALVQMPSADRARHHAESLGDGLYFMALERTPRNPLHLAIKRAIDVAGALLGMVVCGVVFLVLAPMIAFKSPGPIIFKQTRVGRNGRHFTLYKFRTMRASAEHEKADLLDQNQMQGPLFKIRHDPRITGLGRYLRATYLDELPQFWNVLKGDMSLVGTRPPTPAEVLQYSPRHRRRLSVRPGITGLWQSQGNGRVSDFEQVVQLDCHYIDNWSLLLDLRILLRTCLTVVRLAGH